MTLRYIYATAFAILALLASAVVLGNQRHAHAEAVTPVPVDPCEDIFSQLPFPEMGCDESGDDEGNDEQNENPPVDPCEDIFPHIPTMPECEDDGGNGGGGDGGGEEEDVCPNIDGSQTEIPEGKELSDGECVDAPQDGGSSGGSGGSSGGGGGGGSGGGGGGSVLGTTTPAVCEPYITTFMRRGQTNDPEQVMRLQSLLKEYEGMEVPETGEYDVVSEAAIKAFQLKYADEVLAPWGIKEPTGYVFLTTRKKLNEVYCNNTSAFPLTEEEQMHIESSKKTPQQVAVRTAPAPTPVVNDEPEEEHAEEIVLDEQPEPVRGNRITDFFRRLFDRFR